MAAPALDPPPTNNPRANVPQTRPTGPIGRRSKVGAAQAPSKLATVSPVHWTHLVVNHQHIPEVVAVAHCDVRVRWAAHGAASLPCGVVGEPRRKLGPIATVGLFLFFGVGFKKWALGFRQSFPASFLGNAY